MTIKRSGRWPAPRCQHTLPTFFIANLTALAAVKDLRRLPVAAVILANLFGGKLLDGIKTARARRRAKAQPGVPARPDQKNRSFRNLAEAGSITETAVAGQHQHLVAPAGPIQF